jgi:hypothetical protein
LHAEIVLLSQHYAELHRQTALYSEQIARRGVDPRTDRDILAFVERAVLALDHCAYESSEPTSTPDQFFREVERAGRRVALGLDLSESTRLYFAELGQADASYGTLLEEERDLLVKSRDVQHVGDLAESIARAERTLSRLRRLVEALEARYIDYRVNRSVESLRFLLDGDGEQFFLSVATPGHPQRDLETLTFVFGQLSLASRQRYRLVFLGEGNASPWNPGDAFRTDIRINPGTNDARPMSREVVCVLPGQRNFAADFEPGDDIASVTGLQVTVQPGTRIRGCILYQRRLGVSGGRSALMTAEPATPALMQAIEHRGGAPITASENPAMSMSGEKKAIKVTIKPSSGSK